MSRLLLGLTVVLAGCRAGPDGAEPARSDTLGVTLSVPDGWDEQASDEAPGVVAARRWAPGDGVENLQIVVGCDGTAEELAAGAAQAPRDPLVVTDAVELEAPDVPGLDAVHRLQLTLGAGRPDDASTVQVSGLYGEADGALVLIEVAQRPGAGGDAAEDVFDSLDVDPTALRAACDDG